MPQNGKTVQFVDSSGQRNDTGLCERQLNLLAHAQAIELDIGSRCGGHGICGGDRVRVRSDSAPLSAPTELEKQHLTDEEITQGWRLACQCFPDQSNQQITLQLSNRIDSI